LYDPEKNELAVYVRGRMALRLVRPSHNFVSPRLEIRFDLSGEEMVVYRPDGRRFFTPEEIEEAQQQADEAARRSRRLAELGRRACGGEATPEELPELERLETEALG